MIAGLACCSTAGDLFRFRLHSIDLRLAQVARMAGLVAPSMPPWQRQQSPSKASVRCSQAPLWTAGLPGKGYSTGLASIAHFPRQSQSSFRYSCLEPSSPFDAVLISAKDCDDGSIMFKFRSPDQHVSKKCEEVARIEEEEGSFDAHDLKSIQDASRSKEAQFSNEMAYTQDIEEQQQGKSANSSSAFSKEKETSDVHGVRAEDSFEATSSCDAGASPGGDFTRDQEDSVHGDSIISDTVEMETGVVGVRATETAVADDQNGEKVSVGDEEMLQIRRALSLHSGAAMRPHPGKAATGGEDAYFIEGIYWVGVADGVGGWALEGINAGFYARELMSNCSMLIQKEQGVPNPKNVLTESAQRTKAIGTCTALLAALHKQTLYIVNVGDCGFIVIRDGKVVAKSNPMQRAFNFPYQIGTGGDDPEIADTYEVSVDKGDVLVLGTDGFYDNVYETEIVNVIQSALQGEDMPEVVAEKLVTLAHTAGASSDCNSPFSDAAFDVGYSYSGGKLDDVTVIVSFIE